MVYWFMEVVHGTKSEVRKWNHPAFMKQQKLGSHYNDGTTMPLNCTTARAISSLHVRFHVPCEFFWSGISCAHASHQKKTELSSTPCFSTKWFLSLPFFSYGVLHISHSCKSFRMKVCFVPRLRFDIVAFNSTVEGWLGIYATFKSVRMLHWAFVHKDHLQQVNSQILELTSHLLDSGWVVFQTHHVSLDVVLGAPRRSY